MVDVGEMMGLKQLGLYPAMFARGARLKDADFKTYAGFYMRKDSNVVRSWDLKFLPSFGWSFG